MLRDTPIIVESLPPCGFLYFRSSHSDNFSMEMGLWNFRKVCWIEAGSGFLEYEDKSLPIKVGDVLFIEADLRHRFTDNKGDPCTLSMVCYDELKIPVEFKKLHQNLLLKANTNLKITDPWRRNFLHDHFRKTLIEQSRKSHAFEELILAGFIELLVFLLRATDQKQNMSSNEKLIEGLTEYLKENFVKEISVDELADMCGMSSRSLSRHFKDFTNTTIVKYITELRINYACERLRETRQISFSAFDAGFNDISFFYRVFKKYKGITPRQFLQNQINKKTG